MKWHDKKGERLNLHLNTAMRNFVILFPKKKKMKLPETESKKIWKQSEAFYSQPNT
jgi:hypothetical protein